MSQAAIATRRPLRLIALMRPHQWIKNGFVLLGAVFAHQLGGATLMRVGMAFAAFCAIASAVYVLNDLYDVEADRRHPTKRRRPIASGEVSTTMAGIFGSALVVVACVLAWLTSPMALAFVVAYALMNVAYSLRLKHVVIVDVFIIAAGFMLRILTGTVGIDIEPSSWLLLCGMMITLFLGFAKRSAELLAVRRTDAAGTRRVLEAYTPEVLTIFLAVTAACTVLSYALYTVSPETVALHGTARLTYTVPFIVYGIFRYLYLLFSGGSGQDTARDLLTDKHLIATVIGWTALTVWILA